MLPTMVKMGVAVAAAAFSLLVADAACADEPFNITYARTSNRMYVNEGCATIADLMSVRLEKNGTQKGPIWHFNNDTKEIAGNYTGTYYMTASIFIRFGATLEIDGSDCKTLLLASNSSYTGRDALNIRAYGGNLVIQDTKIFSWDFEAGTHDMNFADGRAYVSAVSEFITGREEDKCPGDPYRGTEGYSTGEAKNNMGIARMDIYNSELAYLGCNASESYGIAYKARGLCKTLVNIDIFDDDKRFIFNGEEVQYAVYGDIFNSFIHHNFFGHYSYGHQGGRWINNTLAYNFGYGFDPHDDSDHVQIINNTVHHNGWHGIIASKRCNNVTIAGNTVHHNGKNGLMLHRQCDDSKVYDNYAHHNNDSGLALYESSNCEVYDNTFYWNQLSGIRWSNGANNNTVKSNKIKIRPSGKYALYMYQGSDEPQAAGNVDGRIKNNLIRNNKVWSRKDQLMKIQQADNNIFENNKFRKGKYAEFKDSTGNMITGTRITNADFYFIVGEETCFGGNDEGLPLCT